jgi:hypothetical protein
MPRRKKHAVRPGFGSMCNICGTNCGKGGALKKHIEGEHNIKYDHYKDTFYKHVKTLIVDAWDDSVSTSDGKTVITHVLVRRFIGEAGKRRVRKTAR